MRRYLGNLPWWTTDVELGAALKPCGGGVDMHIFNSIDDGRSMGFARVVLKRSVAGDAPPEVGRDAAGLPLTVQPIAIAACVGNRDFEGSSLSFVFR